MRLAISEFSSEGWGDTEHIGTLQENLSLRSY
jgi:hypothetical protein